MRSSTLDAWPAAGLALVAASSLALARPASAELVWEVARASGDASSRGVSASSSGLGSSSSTWYFCQPGETLRFGVAGAEKLRIEVRAVIAGDVDRIRYTIALDDGSPERYERPLTVSDVTSTLETVGGELSPPLETDVLLSETDVLVYELDRAADMLRIWPHDVALGPLLIRVSSNDGSPRQTGRPAPAAPDRAGPAAAPTAPKRMPDLTEADPSTAPRSRPSRARHELDGIVRLTTGGHDSNPYLTPRTGAPAVGEAFWPGELTVMYTGKLHRSFHLSARARTSATVYGAKILNESAHAFELSQEIRPRGRKGVRIKLEQRYRLRNSTFFGRGAEDEYSTTTDVNETISLADRFDYQDARVRARVKIPLLERLELETRGWWLTRDYAEDYEEHADIDAIDYSRWSGSLRATVSIARTWSLRGEWAEGRKSYREKFARSASGTSVTAVATRHALRTLDVEITRRPRSGLRLSAAVERESTEDLYEGYWDSRTTAWTAGAGWKWTSGFQVHARMRGADTEYLNAHLDFDESQPLKSKSSLRYELEAAVPLSGAWTWWLEFERANRDNNNESFAYDQSVTLSGLELRF